MIACIWCSLHVNLCGEILHLITIIEVIETNTFAIIQYLVTLHVSILSLMMATYAASSSQNI